MGHEKHLVEGIILDSNDFGESGRILKILTKEFGVMSLVATGVRELKSKMKSSLDILNLVDFEFVEGREVNRLVGIFPKENHDLFYKIIQNGDVIKKRRVISNVVNFVLRTVVGQTNNDVLWESFLEGLSVMGGGKASAPSIQDFQSFEIIWLIKILVSLGYWEAGKLDNFSTENFEFLKLAENKKQIIDEINKSIQSTHL